MSGSLNVFEAFAAGRQRVVLEVPERRRAPARTTRTYRGVVRPAVLTCLQAAGRPLTAQEVVARTGLEYIQVINAIRALRAGNKVRRVPGSRPPTYRTKESAPTVDKESTS